MLWWVGKRPLREVRAYPAQLVERFRLDGEASGSVDWSEWPDRFERGGLLFHGDNKEVLAYLLAQAYAARWTWSLVQVRAAAAAKDVSMGPDRRAEQWQMMVSSYHANYH